MKHFSDPCQNAQLKETNCNKFILDCINKCLCLVQIEAFWRAQFFFWQAKNNTTVSWVHAWRRFHSLSIKKTSAGSGSSPRSPGVQFSLNRRHGWIRKTWQTAVFLLVGKGTDIQIGNLFQVALGWFRLVWVGLGWFKDHQESAIAAFFCVSFDAFNLVLIPRLFVPSEAGWLDWLKRSVCHKSSKRPFPRDFLGYQCMCLRSSTVVFWCSCWDLSECLCSQDNYPEFLVIFECWICLNSLLTIEPTSRCTNLRFCREVIQSRMRLLHRCGEQQG